MQRDDWLWLAIKVAALYLLVSAAESFAGGVGALVDSGWRGGSASDFLASGATSAVAGVLLLFCGPRWLGVREGSAADGMADANGSAASRPSRQDWLWLGCKGLGLWLVASVVGTYLGLLRFPEAARSVFVFVSLLATAVVGCWLLLSDTVPRLAGGRTEPSRGRAPRA